MKSNLDLALLEAVGVMAREIYVWSSDRSHPEHYASVKNLSLVRDFVHTLDLLETVLTRFAISTHLTRIALDQLDVSLQPGSLGWEFWRIDIEEFFSANLLELCYQLSNAWKTLQDFADKEQAFAILRTKFQKPNETLLARHKATHFRPSEFEDHHIAQQYSILRRPYRIKDGKLEKELAKFTMPRVAALIRDSIAEGYAYLKSFREATVD